MSNTSRKFELLGTPTKLPLSVAISVAYRSIRVRITRSLVTVSSVVLAVTFLLVVLGGEISSNAVYRKWVSDAQPGEDASQLRTLLVQPRNSLQLLTSLHGDPEGTVAWATSQGFPITRPEQNTMADALTLANWLKTLKPSQRYLLIRNKSIGQWLLDFNAEEKTGVLEPQAPTNSRDVEEVDPWAHLPYKVRQLVSVAADLTGTRLPITPEAALALGEKMPAVAESMRQLAQAESLRLEQVIQAGGPEAVVDQVIAGSSQAAPLHQLINGMTDTRQRRLIAQLESEKLRNAAIQVLIKPRLTSTNGEGESEESAVSTLSLGALVDGRLEKHPLKEVISEELVSAIGSTGLETVKTDVLKRRTLDGLRSTFSDMNYNPESGKERTFWLVLLSLLVCVVGIVNSMMMAVTERFREIATMKCLGAMDGFILKTFMIESGSVGFVGAILGAVIGIILVLIQSSVRYGASFWSSLPAQYLLLAAVASLFCGLVLTILGALLPAYKAARMHPIEAMRLEA